MRANSGRLALLWATGAALALSHGGHPLVHLDNAVRRTLLRALLWAAILAKSLLAHLLAGLGKLLDAFADGFADVFARRSSLLRAAAPVSLGCFGACFLIFFHALGHCFAGVVTS
jgi:hypothetical protein